jgi:FAD/FMN-containing dehydrogenase
VDEAKRLEIKKRLATLVAEGSLVEDEMALAGFAEAVFPVETGSPVCAVRPADTAGVKSIVELAASAGLNLVPVSSTPPHIKGGAVPSGEGVIVDMSGMDRIIHFDRRNKVAVVEPGVTFDALNERARQDGLRALMPLLPRSGKSVLGSYLEREPVLIPKYHWDMTDPLLCAEVVFGTGDVFRTGSSAGPGSLTDQWAVGNAQKNPMGPAATDLVKLVQGAQGTMGIVTWGSVKLELKPEIERFRFVTGESLEPLLVFGRELARKKLGDELLILDSTAFARALTPGPGEADELSGGSRRFTLIYCVSGYRGYLPEERVTYQERDIGRIAARLGVRPVTSMNGAGADEVGRMLAGPCPDPHWKSRAKGACQDVFFLTTMDLAPGFLEVMEEVARRHGIAPGEVGMYVQPVLQGRACHTEFNLPFDPADDSERKRAAGAAGEASARMADMGAFFSRPYEPWVGHAYARCPDTVDALRRMKGVFDPAGILNRGKLCFKGGGAGGPG